MFYSHEILTSRKHGVATVWLVATLGAKSWLKKINRKAILDVDIIKACDTVREPEAPMALRLQSNLLIGISRVYWQQCDYVLKDAEDTQMNMRTVFKLVRTVGLDSNAGKAKPEQLIIQDDPAFLPDFFPTLDIDLSIFDSSQASSFKSLLSDPQKQSSQSSGVGDMSPLGIVIPSSGTSNRVGSGFNLAQSVAGSVHGEAQPGLILEEDSGFLPDIDFNFDADGNIVELDPVQQPTLPQSGPPGRVRSDSAVSARVRQEHQEGQQQIVGDEMDIDTGLPMFDNQEASHLPPGEAFPEAAPEADQPQVAQDDQEMDGADSARVGRRRGPRIIPLDRTQQLRKADLVNWDENYLANMEEARQHKNAYTRSRQAKINAQWFVFGHGLNGVGTCPGLAHVPNPLAMFSGTKLWEAIVGFELETGRKRERSASRSTDSERRTRPRIDDDQPAIHDTIEEDGFMPPFDDDSIERGRHAQPQLDEQSSQMPWNISSRPQSRQTSRQGSALPAIHGVGSVGAAGIGAMAPPGLDPFSRRASRRISSSPLAGRGLPLPEGLDISSDADIGGDTFLGGMASNDPALQDFSFQLHGPAAAVSTQTAAESQWVRTALDAESGRFLEFVRSAQEHNPDPSEVIFQEMLPPEQHTKIVASQAFYHILTLASKGLVKAVQAPEGGDLILSVVEV